METTHTEEWQRVRLGDLGTLIRGVTYTRSEAQPDPAAGFMPILRANNIDDGRLNLQSDLVYVPAERVRVNQRLRPGDLVIAMSSGSRSVVGKAALLEDEWVGSFGAFCGAFRLVSPIAEARFVYLLFQSEGFRQHIERSARGTNINNLTKEHVLGYAAALPSLEEQRAIVSSFRAVQHSTQVRLRELDLERERKAALLSHLFARGTRGEETKETEIGEMPASWRLVPFGSLIGEGPQNGIYKPQDAYGDGTPILRINDFDNDGRLTSPGLQRVRLEEGEAEKYELGAEDIVINRVNSLTHLGKSALITPAVAGAVFESNMMRVRLNTAVVRPDYASSYLLSDRARGYLRSRAKRAVAQSSINQTDVRSLPVPLPSLDEQAEIAGAIGACDAKIGALEREIALHTELFHVLLDELMTGRRSALPLTLPASEVEA